MFHKLKKAQKLSKATSEDSKVVDTTLSYNTLESPLSPGIYTLTIGAIINKKRHGEDLTSEEIYYFVNKIYDKSIREIQIGAFLMAVCMQGLTTDEIFTLTNALTNAGAVLEWPREWRHLVVDEHSTGGVGDKVSVILAPALAVCGLKVSMMFQQNTTSFMGGILEKLSSIPGFRSQFTIHEIRSLLSNIGCCIVRKAEHLVPCNDALFQAGITGTEDSPYLMIASVLSTKAAQGLAALVLDVKFGTGAFTKSREEARCIAYDMLTMGWRMGIKTSAIVSSMDMPIGTMIGNALEIVEAIECLKGHLSEDIFELVIKLGAELLHLLGSASRKDGAEMIASTLQNGSALNKFREMLQAQNVSDSNIRNLIEDGKDIWSVLPKAPLRSNLQCHVSGYVHCIKAFELGQVVKLMCNKKSDDASIGVEIDTSVGLQLLVNPGMPVNKGQDWLIIHHKEAIPLEYKLALQHALIIKPDPIPVSSLITEIIAQGKEVQDRFKFHRLKE